MNIGIFTDAYYPQINGVVTSTRLLKKELENLGHKVTIVTVSDPKIKGKDIPNVLRLPSIPFWKLPNFRVGSIYSRKIMKEIKNLNLDIIHTQTEFSIGIFARIVAKTLHIPLVHTYHTMYEDYTHYLAGKHMNKYAKEWAQKASKAICKNVDGVIVPTDKVKIALEGYGLEKDVHVVPTGIDFTPFNKEQYEEDVLAMTRKEVGITADDAVVIFVGRIAKEKSIDTVIKSMPSVLENCPNAKLLIVGGGPELDNLKEITQNMNLNQKVLFTGEKPWEEIGRYYQMGDVFVSASTSETQGLTFTEAMAADLPVVAKYDTNLDGIMKDGVNGKFFREDGELAEILIELLNNTNLSSKLVENAHEMIKPLSSKCFGKSIEEVYSQVLQEHETSTSKIRFRFSH